MNCNECLPWNLCGQVSERWCLPIRSVIDIFTEGLAAASGPPSRRWQNQGRRFSAARGSTRHGGPPGQIYASEWKLILFTFNLLFPPLWNLERAKSCNSCIKNKCSGNGPTCSMRWEASVARPSRPAAKSNRYAQYSSTHSRITVTRTETSTRSRENKTANFLCPCRLQRGGESDEV